MNILLANFAKMVNDSGGLAKVTCAFAKEMYQRGYKVTLVYSDDKEGDFFFEVPKDVTLHVGSSCYASLYYSDRALVVPEKTKAYTYNVINDNLVVSHCYEPSQTIPAGVGVVVAAQADGDYTFALSTLAGTVDQYNKLRGSDVDATTVGGNVYYKLSLNANNDPGTIGFYWGAASGAAFTNKAHKAYLALTREGAATAKSFLLDGTTTGVDNVSVQKIVDAPLYNISGQRVGKSYKGIVISNGKKYIQK